MQESQLDNALWRQIEGLVLTVYAVRVALRPEKCDLRAGLRLPINGTIYLKIIPAQCQQPAIQQNGTVPESHLLRFHSFFGKRPVSSSLYAYFDQRTWSAYLGMGDDHEGFAITGKSHHLVDKSEAFCWAAS